MKESKVVKRLSRNRIRSGSKVYQEFSLKKMMEKKKEYFLNSRTFSRVLLHFIQAMCFFINRKKRETISTEFREISWYLPQMQLCYYKETITINI